MSIAQLLLPQPVKSGSAELPALEAAQMLRRRDFDVAGVKESAEGEVIGWIMRDDLKNGLVLDHKRSLTASELIADLTPLSGVLGTLKKRQFTFVMIGSKIRGIVTRADLNKPPARIYLFSIISLLEMHLSFWIRDEYPDNSWQIELDGDRLSDAKKLQEKRRRRNQEQTLLECLQFCDKRDLVVSKRELAPKIWA